MNRPLKILAFLTASALAATIASCQQRSSLETAVETPAYDLQLYGDLNDISPRHQIVVFWYSAAYEQEEALLELVDTFNRENEWGITVIGEQVNSDEDVFRRIHARIESDALPQIVEADRHWIAAYAALDASVPLDPYVQSAQWGYTTDELNDFIPVALAPELTSPFAERYAWPFYVSLEVLYYNADWLTEAGHTTPPQSWEAFEEIACAVSNPEAGIYGYEFSADASTFANLLLSRGGSILDDQAAAYTFDSRRGREVLSAVQELLTDGCAAPKTVRAGDRADFAAGRVLFTIDSTSNLPHYHNEIAKGAGFNWSLTTLPTTLDEPQVLATGPALTILRSTPERQLASWLFLKWLSEPEQQARWARATHTLSVRISTADLLQDVFAEDPQYEQAHRLLRLHTTLEPGVAGYAVCQEAITQMLEATINLGNPRDLLARAIAACNESLPATAR